MEKRLSRDELIELVESLKIDPEEFWILSSGALVMRGIYPDAGDLDIAITKKGFEQLKENFKVENKHDNFYKVTDKIECVIDTFEPYKVEKVGNFYVQSIEAYYSYLVNSNREKDKARIPLVEAYMNSNK